MTKKPPIPTRENVDRAMRLTKLAKLATEIPDYDGLSKKAHDLTIRALKAAKALLDRDSDAV